MTILASEMRKKGFEMIFLLFCIEKKRIFGLRKVFLNKMIIKIVPLHF
jgi:hypothetical protein